MHIVIICSFWILFMSFNCLYCVVCVRIACPAGQYGENCSGHCLCQNGGSCDSMTGQCSCPPGWTGAACELGEHLTPNFSWSNILSFSPDVSFPTLLECEEGHYGENCTQTCSCVNRGRCDKVTGRCVCQPGWVGELCQSGDFLSFTLAPLH